MFDHYVINVAQAVPDAFGQRFKHIFATAPSSLRDLDTALALLKDLRRCYPEGGGYNVTMTHWVARGTTVQA
jgi:hypothetical protein